MFRFDSMNGWVRSGCDSVAVWAHSLMTRTSSRRVTPFGLRVASKVLTVRITNVM